jgi:hypothetical protein
MWAFTCHAQTLYNAKEDSLWRERAKFLPANVAGKGHTGNWQRIKMYADQFRAKPRSVGNNGRDTCNGWTGNPNGFGEGNFIPVWQFVKAENAAFVYRCMKDTSYGNPAKRLVLWQVRQKGNADIGSWPITLNYQDGFHAAKLVVRLSWTADFVWDLLTPAERSEITAWQNRAGTFYYLRWQANIVRCFPNRLKDDYTVRSYMAGPKGFTQWKEPIWADVNQIRFTAYGGKDVRTHVNPDGTQGNRVSKVSQIYNNREAIIHLAIFYCGVMAKNPVLIADGIRYNKEWLMFAVWQDGTFSEYERNGINSYGNGVTLNNPAQGASWYGAINYTAYMLIADHLAKNGNPELYTFSTRVGAHGTEVPSNLPPKTFATVLDRVMDNYRGARPIYYGKVNDSLRISCQTLYMPKNGVPWMAPYDCAFAIANRWYKSANYQALYQRTLGGVPAYNNNLATASSVTNNWGGPEAEVPSIPFMFGATEGVAYK